jgi:putative ABC transport system permease protein
MLGSFLRRLWYFIRRDQLSAELAEEMRLHTELREESLRRSGLSAADAHYAARRRFGNSTSLHQRSRDMWGLGELDRFRQDLKYAVRRLGQRPGFSIAVISVLALGIGATTAMFSAVDAAMLRPLPFHEPDELLTLSNIYLPSGNARRTGPPSVIEIGDVAAMSDVFSNVAAYASGGLNLADPERPQRVKVGVVTSSFFETLGIPAIRGRAFTASDGTPDAPPVAVLSHGLWTRQFGESDVLGRRIQLGMRSFEVVGVMPPRFGFPEESELWIPLTVPTTRATFEPFRGWLPSSVIARVAPGISPAVAEQRLMERWKQLRVANPPVAGRQTSLDMALEEMAKTGATSPLQQQLVGDRRTALLVLLGATGLLLLIACANVTNLLLSHATLRRREMAVREVLGATRGRLIRQLLTESLALSVAGALIGVLLAPVALATMTAIMPASMAGVAPATLDLRVLGFATALAIFTGVGFGLWPALGGTRDAPIETIKTGGGPGITALGAGRARQVLVVGEIALTVTLLVGAGLMLRSFERVMGVDTGIDRSRVGTLELSFGRGTPSAAVLARTDAILARLAAMPGIEGTAVVNDLPLRGAGGIAIGVQPVGVPRPTSDEGRYARWLIASADYFSTMRIPIRRGRTFTTRDDSLAPRVAVINETMAQLWPDGNALGRTFRSGGPDDPPITVIGIAADVRESGIENEPGPQMYFPIYAEPPERLAIVARSSLPPATLLAHLVDAVRAVDPTQAVYNVRMMDDVVDASMAPRRTNTLLITAFAMLALLLASLGVYGVIANGVAQRSRELGIRAALGATAHDLVALVSREMVWVITLGLLIGVAGSWALARVMESLVFGVSTHDLATFTAVPAVIAVAAILSTLGPAWKARRVDVVEVLRVD